jgi:hypothetical protein
MYMQNNTVLITKVANGYIVELPESVRPIQAGLPFDMAQYEEVLTRIMRKQGKDPLLEELHEPERLKPPKPAIPEKPESLLHIFKEWIEVVEFLEYHFEH